MNASPIRAIVLGAGYRGRAYAAYATAHPEKLTIVGVADPSCAATIAAPMYWRDWREALASHPKADVAIITLPDAEHYECAKAAIAGGYDLLLEKPIARSADECRELIALANAAGRLILVGHVLRYTRYFAHIKAILDSGELGRVVSISHQESVGFLKAAHSFCRGAFSNAGRATPIVLQKCSHDFDLFVWWIGQKCLRVSSFGSIAEFRRDRELLRCVDCPPEVERNCIWSAKKMYLERDDLRYLFADRSDGAMERVVRESDYGRCVYACDNDVPDHQCVNLEFEGGVTVSHTLTCFTAENVRTTRISCTRGEIVGDGAKLAISRFSSARPSTCNLQPPTLTIDNPSRHDGGDFNLMDELVRLVRAGTPEERRRVTSEALESHLIAFAAEASRLAGGAVVGVDRVSG